MAMLQWMHIVHLLASAPNLLAKGGIFGPFTLCFPHFPHTKQKKSQCAPHPPPPCSLNWHISEIMSWESPESSRFIALPMHTWRRAHVGPALRVALVVPGPPHVPGSLFCALAGGTASVAGVAAAAVDPPRTVLDHVPPAVCRRATVRGRAPAFPAPVHASVVVVRQVQGRREAVLHPPHPALPRSRRGAQHRHFEGAGPRGLGLGPEGVAAVVRPGVLFDRDRVRPQVDGVLPAVRVTSPLGVGLLVAIYGLQKVAMALACGMWWIARQALPRG